MKRLTVLSLMIVVSLLWLPVSGFADSHIKTMTLRELVADAQKYAPQITVHEAKAQMDKGSYILIDVREPREYKRGHIVKAINIPRGVLEFKIGRVVPDKNSKIIIYCKVGGRGSLAAKSLKILGYKDVVNVNGGWTGWVKANYPVE